MQKAVTKVNADIRYNCGCGFRTTVAEEADKHVVETRHTLSVLGIVRPPDLPKKEEITQ